MDITHTCHHCLRGKKIFRISLDLYNEEGVLRPGVQRMKKFEFICHYCRRKSFFDFYRFSHPDIILLLKRLDQQQNELIQALDQLVQALDQLINILQSTTIDESIDFKIG